MKNDKVFRIGDHVSFTHYYGPWIESKGSFPFKWCPAYYVSGYLEDVIDLEDGSVFLMIWIRVPFTGEYGELVTVKLLPEDELTNDSSPFTVETVKDYSVIRYTGQEIGKT